VYQQNYDPLGHAWLSTVVAAIPIIVLLYFIALHRHRDAHGNVHFGISAPYAAFFGVIAAFLVSSRNRSSTSRSTAGCNVY
jgi:lactate permease